MKDLDKYHKWVEWSDEDQVYIGKCTDLISRIHGDDPVVLYGELCEIAAGCRKPLQSRRSRPATAKGSPHE